MLRHVPILLCLALSLPQALADSLADPARDEVATTLCALIETSAAHNDLPVDFFAKLIWRESALHADAISPAGARGIAQFMPGTSAERGLANPFDPEEAIPASAKLLAELRDQFGNLGLAAAAYNAGPNAVAKWRAGEADLPLETEDYVLIVTGQAAAQWLKDPPPKLAAEPVSCLRRIATLRAAASPELLAQTPFSPWGVQLAGAFVKARALAQFERERARYAAVLGGATPFVLARRNRSRGWRAFFQVRLPAASRREADALCRKIQSVGGACVTLRT